MKRFLLPCFAVVLTSGCSMIDKASDMLFAKKQEEPIAVQQIIVQPVYVKQPKVAQYLHNQPTNDTRFLSPYTYPYRQNVYSGPRLTR